MTLGELVKNLALLGYPANGKAASGGGAGLKVPGLLFSRNAAVTLTGTTAQTQLDAFVIPANTLGPNGVLRVWPLLNLIGSGGTKSAIFGIGSLSYSLAGGNIGTTGSYSGLLMLRGANSQTAQVFCPNGTGIGQSGNGVTAQSIDFTQAQTITMKGQLASASDSLVLSGWYAEVLNP